MDNKIKLPWAAVATELKREIKMRKAVYPGLVRLNKITQEEMDYRIDCMVQCLEMAELEAVDGATQMNLLE